MDRLEFNAMRTPREETELNLENGYEADENSTFQRQRQHTQVDLMKTRRQKRNEMGRQQMSYSNARLLRKHHSALSEEDALLGIQQFSVACGSDVPFDSRDVELATSSYRFSNVHTHGQARPPKKLFHALETESLAGQEAEELLCASDASDAGEVSTNGGGKLNSGGGAKGKCLAGGKSAIGCGFLSVLKGMPGLAALLVFIPLGFASHWLEWGDSWSFGLNFMAIVPQAWLMGQATEDMAGHMGQVTGGLLNAWFGNIVEMLLCIAGLRQNELAVVKSTLVGSILSNLLLVTGCSFLFGGFRHKVQEFSAIGASTNASLMTLSCLCLGLPTMYGTIMSDNDFPDSVELHISRSVSFFLIFMYIQFLIFQLGTHNFLFTDDEESETEMTISEACLTLAGCTVLCTFNSEYLIASIQGVVNSYNISKSFIGIILLPIIGNAAEHYTSVIVAMRNKMDLSLACAVGSSCQMALFVTPFTVLAGWCMGVGMSLNLHAFEMLVLLLAVLIVTSILQDGYSNWLEGSMLLSAYLVIALIYYFQDAATGV